jgi:hypothetical protein
MGNLIKTLIGSYHNTSIFNSTNDRTLIILTDNERKKTQFHLDPNDLKYVKIPKGSITISPSLLEEDQTNKSNIYSDESSFGFIIIKQDAQLMVVRASANDPRLIK